MEMNPPNTILGRDVIDAFKTDVQSFFKPEVAFQLRIEEDQSIQPRCVGVMQKTRIVLPDYFSKMVVETFEQMALLLMVLGHETAHYLHRHNEHRDKSVAESRAIEMWADFYGTKAALVAVTHGKSLNALAQNLPGWDISGDRVDAFAGSLAKLSTTYFNTNSAKYDRPAERLQTCIAGMLSFFERQFIWQAARTGRAEDYWYACCPITIVQRGMALQLRIYRNKTIYEIHEHSGASELSSDSLTTINSVHRSIQDEQIAMFNGMNPFAAIWLDLDYSASEEQRRSATRARMSVLTDTLAKLGLTGG